ncbi:hypothetical protein HK103_007543 [Boothiomyces macroporosus]|uniref:Tyrosinase copper-binding domain-containing protein n=1 Tax=Boothiomyces macroporosus TaxID=261099 RepID=A0AAD5Y1R4_9FUNG|nr:hypothetical protein HK103_007543 [Boothiomyces macroporosus]
MKDFRMKASIFAYLLVVSSVLSCSPGPVRKEWRELTPSQQKAFISAVTKLNQRKDDTSDDSTDPATWSFAHFAVVHNRYEVANHNQGKTEAPPFFPWHRIFLHYYEKALKSIDPSVILPYWDWSQDSQHPLASTVFAQSAFGGQFQPNTGCIVGGSFAGWQSPVNGGCLKRCTKAGSVLYSSSATVGYMNASPTYSLFNWQIQNIPHAAVHSNIGGICGDNSPADLYNMASAGDPIFYMHHAMVDKIWMLWQDQCPSKFAKAYDGPLNAPMAPFRETVADILNFSAKDGNFCYGYTKSGIDVPKLTQACPSKSTTASASTATSVAQADGSVEDYFVELRALDLIPGSAQILQKEFPGFSNSKINTIDHFMHNSFGKARSTHKRDNNLNVILDTANSTTTPILSAVPTSTVSDTQATPTDYPAAPENVTVPVIPAVLPVYRLHPNYTVAAPPADDKSNLYKLRHPSLISDHYIETMKLPKDQTRYFEFLGKQFTDDANNIPGYIPPAALINFYKYNNQNPSSGY